MKEIIYIIKILYIIFVPILMYLALKIKRQRAYSNNTFGQLHSEKSSFPFIALIIFCIIYAFYALICSGDQFIGDRYNYAIRFSDDIYLNYIKTQSMGLYWIFILLHSFTYEPNLLFFAVTFIYSFIVLITFNECKESTPIAILLWGLSLSSIYSYYLLKQSIAIAFGGLALILLFNKKWLFSVLSIILAICFHESAYIIVLVLLVVLVIRKNRKIGAIFSMVAFISILFFGIFNKYFISIAILIPGIGNQLVSYVSDEELILSSNYLTIFKGLPYFVITFYGFIKRKEMASKINNYYSYLFVSFFASLTFFASFYMYWMWRFGAYFFFPSLIFAGKLFQVSDNKNEKQSFLAIVILLFLFITIRALFQYYFLYGGIS